MWSLFAVFVVVSVYIVVKRVYRLVKLGFMPVQIIGSLGVKLVQKIRPVGGAANDSLSNGTVVLPTDQATEQMKEL